MSFKSTSKQNKNIFQRYKKYWIPIFIIVISIFGIVGFFTLRPEIFYFCNILSILAPIALIVNNKYLNGFVVAAFPMYVFVIFGGFVLIHFFVFGFILAVLIVNWRNISPGMVILSSVFIVIYIFSFINSIKPEYGEKDPFHQIFNVPMGIMLIFMGVVLAAFIRSTHKVKRWF